MRDFTRIFILISTCSLSPLKSTHVKYLENWKTLVGIFKIQRHSVAQLDLLFARKNPLSRVKLDGHVQKVAHAYFFYKESVCS